MNKGHTISGGPPDRLVDAVVFDLDGVIRHWNDDELDRRAAEQGLPPRAVLDIAFSEELGRPAVTGRLTFEQWMGHIRARVLHTYGPVAQDALELWETNVGSVDTDMVAIVRRVRRQVPVALLSNGTTRLHDDLEMLDLLVEFDAVFNTAEIGVAKPDPGAFEHVLAELGVCASRAAFVDDLEANVAGARAVGMRAQHFTAQSDAPAVDVLTRFLAGLGIDATT